MSLLRDRQRRIVGALTPDLLKAAYRGLPGGDTAGHCYHAAEALFHAVGGRLNTYGLVPHVARSANGLTHWWLQTRGGFLRVDPTADQFTSRGLEPPYAGGRACGFLTSHPSRRARVVLTRAGLSIKGPNS